jgi:hypothetical protein
LGLNIELKKFSVENLASEELSAGDVDIITCTECLDKISFILTQLKKVQKMK